MLTRLVLFADVFLTKMSKDGIRVTADEVGGERGERDLAVVADSENRLDPFPSPAFPMLARFVFLLLRSCRNTSLAAFVSPFTRLVADEVKVT